MSETVVLYSIMAMGHILPAVELAKLFRGHGYAVALAIVDIPKSPKSNETLARLSASNPSLSFHLISAEMNLGMKGVAQSLKDSGPAFLSLARSLPSVRAVVIDFLCAAALDLARELGVPGYFFYTSGASIMTVFLHLPVLDATMSETFKDMGDTILHFPGLSPFPASCIPEGMNDRNSETFKTAMDAFKMHPQGDGIIVNSFNWLEGNTLTAIKTGLILPGERMPPVYALGPLVSAGEEAAERHQCLAWLDEQPKQSVVFLCFGSMGSLPVEQLKEIALGLERSGLRFLWAVRSPLEDPKNFFGPRMEKELDELLPEGFMARTEGRGMVVKSWVPQVEVLRHEATGAFVTHCGWNSVLEGVTSGVPMLCWPLYAEQKLNKTFMVLDMEIGWEMVKEGGDEAGLVKAEEVEAKVRLVMESEEGKKLRERLTMAKEQAAKALEEGGSSQLEFAEMVKNLERAKNSA